MQPLGTPELPGGADKVNGVAVGIVTALHSLHKLHSVESLSHALSLHAIILVFDWRVGYFMDSLSSSYCFSCLLLHVKGNTDSNTYSRLWVHLNSLGEPVSELE